VAIAFVRHFSDFTDSETNSRAISVPAAGVTAGDLLIISFVCSSDTISMSSIVDTGLNSYTIHAPFHDVSGAITVGVAWSIITTGLVNGNTITVNLAAGLNGSFSCAEFSGITPSSPFDQYSENRVPFDATYTSDPTPTTSQANELVYGAHGTRTPARTYTPDGTFSQLVNQNHPGGSWKHVTQYRIVSSVGTYESFGTINSDDSSVNLVATFKEGAVTGTATLIAPHSLGTGSW